LAQRFEFYYTPKRGRWLNMIEIEFSAMARQCLYRRIPTQDQLSREVLQCILERAKTKILIHWQFSLEKARSTLNSHIANGPSNPLTNSRRLDLRSAEQPR
jgi:hypothetical protein